MILLEVCRDDYQKTVVARLLVEDDHLGNVVAELEEANVDGLFEIRIGQPSTVDEAVDAILTETEKFRNE